jgi:hypothetical protein
MLRINYIFLFFLLMLSVNSFAQSDSLPVKINIDKANTGDSLWLIVSLNSYTKTSSLMFTASLQNAVVKDTFFLPVIDSVSQYCFVFPSAIHDNLLLRAYFYPGIFKVSGMVKNTGKQPGIKAIIITENEKVFNKEISLKKDNSFSLPALVFEKQASFAFNYIDEKRWQTHPDVELSVKPTIADFKQLVFSSAIIRIDEKGNLQTEKIILNKDSLDQAIKADDKYKILKDVEVTASKKSNIEKFNGQYSTGIFNDGSERVIDCLDNSSILSYPNCLNYLQTQIPGLTISTEQFGDMVVKWRGQTMKAFYIDEIAVDIEQILGVSTADIAMLKVYPPPFFGSSSGSGGAIALYTRHGDYSKSGTGIKWLFSIRGYSPQINVLFKKD